MASISGGPGTSPSDSGASTPRAPKRARRATPPPPPPPPRADPLRAHGFALTAVNAAPPAANVGAMGVSLADVVCGEGLETALVSNFCVDPRWLFDALPALLTVRRCLVLAVGDEGVAPMLRRLVEDKRVLRAPVAGVACPAVERYGTHHAKFFLLRYADPPAGGDSGVGRPRGTRVVVVTGNLLEQEYDRKTQGLWWQDFPAKAGGDDDAAPDAGTTGGGDFGGVLARYVAALNTPRPGHPPLPANARRLIERVLAETDFSSARADLIAAVPGRHAPAHAAAWGHGALRARLAASGGYHPSLAAAPLFAQCSSIGRVDEGWVKTIVDAASGGVTRGGGGGDAGSAGAPLGPPAASPAHPLPFSIVWPTADEVRNSSEGWDGGSSIPARAVYLDAPAVRARLCTWGPATPSARARAMPHIKTLVRACPTTGRVAWAVLGSANLSAAAWGATPTKRGAAPGSVHIKSFELGVLLTPQREARYRAHPHYGFCVAPLPPSSSLFGAPPPPPPAPSPPTVDFWTSARAPVGGGDGAAELVGLPVPYDVPPALYGPTDKPWVADVPFAGPDVFGRVMVGGPPQ